MIIEVSIQNESYYKGGLSQSIKDGYFSVWNAERIKKAFNNGNGTQKDFEEYKKNNHKKYCYIMEVNESQLPEEYL